MALVVNSQKRQTISVKGTEFFQKSGSGVLLNVLAFPAFNLASYAPVPIPLVAQPYKSVQFWFDASGDNVTGLTIGKYPLYATVGTYQSIPVEVSVSNLQNGITLTHFNQLFDIRQSPASPVPPFEQLNKLPFLESSLNVSIRLDSASNTIILKQSGASYFRTQTNSGLGSGKITGQLTMITQKMEA